MKLDTLFPSKYLKADDFTVPEVLTIKRVQIEEVGQDREEKPVLYFQEVHKGMILNKTNTVTLCEITGNDDTDGWEGAAVEIYKATTMFQGKSTPCLRVRAPRRPKPAAPSRPNLAPPDAVTDATDEWDDIPDPADDEPMRRPVQRRSAAR